MNLLTFILTIVTCAFGTQADKYMAHLRDPKAREEKIALVTKSSNAFAAAFYPHIASEFKSNNVIYSPSSVHLIMSLAAYGADKKTLLELKNALHVPFSIKNILYGNKYSVQQQSSSLKNATLDVSTRVYIQENFKIKDGYAQAINFTIPSGILTFNNDLTKVVSDINQWVAESTKYKITKLLDDDDITLNTRMLLLNAVYFKACWASKFNKEKTARKPFQTLSGATQNVLTMNVVDKFNYTYITDMEAHYIELPYQDENLKMVIAMPSEYDGLPEFEKKWSSFNGQFATYMVDIDLSLPKFKIESAINLQSPLEKLGLNNVFNYEASFPGISNIHVYIGKVLQKAYISVDEDGTEAAAVSASSIDDRGNILPSLLKIDKPFYFAIKYLDKILFEGRVVNPNI